MKKFFIVLSVLLSSVLLHAAEPQEIRVALIGSSACQSYGNKDPRLIYGWGEVLGEYFNPRVKILNFAISGYSSKSFIEKGKWEKTLASKPHYVFITIGANDPKKDPKRHTDPETTYRANILRFIRETRAAGAVPILVTLNQSLRWDKKNQRPDFFNGKVFRADRAPYSDVMRSLAKTEKVPCIDLANAQQAAMEKMGLEKAVKYYRVYDLKTMKLDCFHTNLAGAHLLAGLIAEGLAKTDCPLKNELKPGGPDKK